MTLGITTTCHYAQCHYAQCRDLFIVMRNECRYAECRGASLSVSESEINTITES